MLAWDCMETPQQMELRGAIAAEDIASPSDTGNMTTVTDVPMGLRPYILRLRRHARDQRDG